MDFGIFFPINKGRKHRIKIIRRRGGCGGGGVVIIGRGDGGPVTVGPKG